MDDKLKEKYKELGKAYNEDNRLMFMKAYKELGNYLFGREKTIKLTVEEYYKGMYENDIGILNAEKIVLSGDFEKIDYDTFLREHLSRIENLKCVDISELDTSNLNELKYLFINCKNLEEVVGLDKIDTSKVRDMNGMFWGCKSLKSIDLKGFNTENVSDFSNVFFECSNLQTVDLSMLNTSNTEFFINTFGNCKNLKYVNLSNLDMSNVKSTQYLFLGCKNLKEIKGIDEWNTQNLQYATEMFWDCKSLENLNLDNFDFQKISHKEDIFKSTDIKRLSVKNASQFMIYDIFMNCRNIEEINADIISTMNRREFKDFLLWKGLGNNLEKINGKTVYDFFNEKNMDIGKIY